MGYVGPRGCSRAWGASFQLVGVALKAQNSWPRSPSRSLFRAGPIRIFKYFSRLARGRSILREAQPDSSRLFDQCVSIGQQSSELNCTQYLAISTSFLDCACPGGAAGRRRVDDRAVVVAAGAAGDGTVVGLTCVTVGLGCKFRPTCRCRCRCLLHIYIGHRRAHDRNATFGLACPCPAVLGCRQHRSASCGLRG